MNSIVVRKVKTSHGQYRYAIFKKKVTKKKDERGILFSRVTKSDAVRFAEEEMPYYAINKDGFPVKTNRIHW